METRGDVYLLVELASGSQRVPLDEILGSALEWGMEQGLVLDGALATSGAHRAQFWRLREEQPEGQRLEGEQLKHDISVPPGAIARFIEAGAKVCHDILPGVRINPFGHLGDGNIHYNLSPPAGRADFDGKAGQFAQALSALATEMGGSFAAEAWTWPRQDRHGRPESRRGGAGTHGSAQGRARSKGHDEPRCAGAIVTVKKNFRIVRIS